MSMPMPLPVAVAESTGGGGTPFIKYAEYGMTFIGALASDPSKTASVRKVAETVQINGKTQAKLDPAGKPVFRVKKDGKILTEEIIHFITVAGTTVVNTRDGNDGEKVVTPVEPGDHMITTVNGFLRGRLIEARRAMPAVLDTTGKVLIAAGESSCQDIYTLKMTHKSSAVESKTEALALKAAGLTIEDEGGEYPRVMMHSEDDELARLGVRMKLKLEVRAARKEFALTIERANGDNADHVAAVYKAFDLWQTKPWEQNNLIGKKRDEDEEANEPGAPSSPFAEDDEAPF